MHVPTSLLQTRSEARRAFLFRDAYLAFSGGSGKANDIEQMKDVFGGKGAGLAMMSASGVQVPPGLTITTACCRGYSANGKQMPEGLFQEVLSQLAVVELELDRRLGDVDRPLLLSVRSGAKYSMPGMMDTILNLGLNDETVLAMAALTNNPRFAWDSYRRFISMFGNVVLDIAKDRFEAILDALKKRVGLKIDSELDESALRELVASYKQLVRDETGTDFPSDVYEQLHQAIEAVFRSWENPRAVFYRELNKIDHDLGTAVTVQSMVFGNLGMRSATGVCFTRNPNTGEREVYGEYLTNAQGEDVVAGTRTPKRIFEMRDEMPEVHAELIETLARLERTYGDMQDVEFTVEEGRLYFLQTRTGKRTSAAALRIAVDLVEEGVISRDTAITRVEANRLIEVLLPTFLADQVDVAKSEGRLLGKGLAASPGAAIGRIRFEPADVVAGDILVRVETCPDDIVGFFNANGIVTKRGGMTSHAAVVARGMGKPCVAGCEAFDVDLENKVVRIGDLVLSEGEIISIDGSTGEVYRGEIATRAAEMSSHFTQLLAWADARADLKVRANADTPEDALRAREFGAMGIGLCRTEHMFMAEERLPAVRRMILADTLEARLKALDELLPMQLADFIGIFKAMNGLPVTIRLLDPPLHEFLPKLVDLVAEVSVMRATGANESELSEKELLLATVSRLHEVNPMMGLRGCRLGLLYPEINVMQVRAIFLAACQVVKEGGAVEPEIMIPLIGHVEELRVARGILEKVAVEVMESEGVVIPYKFGTMIEVPRAALISADLAELAEFFSFGTNDLTQMTYGLSRDDSEATILRHYQEGVAGADGEKTKILKESPFVVLDREGVGRLMRISASEGRRARPDLKLGICGEHGGEPNSIAFAHELELAYVSCSPFRVAVARLAAAQAAIVAPNL